MQDRRGVLAAEWDADNRCGRLVIDAEVGEQGLEHGQAFRPGAGIDDLDDSVADLGEVEVGVVRFVRGGFEKEGKFVTPVTKLPDLLGDLVDALGDCVAVAWNNESWWWY